MVVNNTTGVKSHQPRCYLTPPVLNNTRIDPSVLYLSHLGRVQLLLNFSHLGSVPFLLPPGAGRPRPSWTDTAGAWSRPSRTSWRRRPWSASGSSWGWGARRAGEARACEQFHCPGSQGSTEPALLLFTSLYVDVTDQTGTLEKLEVKENILVHVWGKARAWDSISREDDHQPPIPHSLQADHPGRGAPSERPRLPGWLWSLQRTACRISGIQ